MKTCCQHSVLRYGLTLTAVLLLTLACPTANHAADQFPRPAGLVNDFANVISPQYEQKLTQVTGELLKKTEVPVVVVTVPDIGGEDYNEYANRLYEAWGIGKKGDDRGVLVFVTLKERKMRIETGYGMEGLIPDGLAGEIRDKYMIPYLKQDRFGEGILNGTLAIANIIAEDAQVSLTGQMPVKRPARKRSLLSNLLPIIIFFLLLLGMGRRRGRGGILPLLLLMSMGGGRGYGRGGFGGFGGGFGGFGGGMSGGGGAGGGF
ncbi:MAG: TPM domain-containing protein [Deltaproteobacteria bacterium]|nr:TPM domain-containing protein [Deltaproteobacteria bacterium]